MNVRPDFSLSIGSAFHEVRGLVLGLALTAALAAAAMAAAAPIGISSIAIALILGGAFAGMVTAERWAKGIAFSARPVLRFGVALLGAQITFGQILGLGIAPVLITLAALILSLLGGLAIARAFGASAEVAVLTACAVSICGASAALAVTSALPRSRSVEHSAAVAIACITLIGTGGMLLYPITARWLDMNDVEAGLFLGASLHEVVQAVGGGFTFSPLAGETATTVKLLRVACLAPVVMMIGYWFHSRSREIGAAAPTLPFFLLGFLAMVVIASTGWLDPFVTSALGFTSRFLLTMAMVALGLKISLPRLIDTGRRSILIVLAQSVVLAAIVLVAMRTV